MKNFKTFVTENNDSFLYFKKDPEGHQKLTKLKNSFSDMSRKIPFEHIKGESDTGLASTLKHQRKTYDKMKEKGMLPKNHTEKLKKALFKAHGHGGHPSEYYEGSHDELKNELK